MRARRVDANHRLIKGAFVQLGCSVIDLYAVGGGCPDLAVSRNGQMVLVEIKTEKGDYTPAQEVFNAEWQGPRATVRDLAGVETVVKALK